ncbi:MAG: hypothetical protein HFJ17_03215 [Clostridia bacterium]|nr:hypothetical protein [Clostridia bacterium]
MKRNKLKLITKILAIVVICLISFIGIYVQKSNRMQNIVKDYQFTKDLKGYRQIMFEVSDALEVLDSEGKVIGSTDQYDDESIKTNSYKKGENPINKEEQLKEENYEKSKKIIEERLNKLGVEDYNLNLEKTNGNIYLQIPEDDTTDRIVSNITETGKFELKDSKEGTVFLTREHLKKASALYNTTETGTVVYLHMQLDKEGTDILKNLSSNDYAKKEVVEENNTAENETTSDKKDNNEEKEEQKEVVLAISGNNVITTSFEEPIEDGVIDLSMNQASNDSEEVTNTLRSTSTIVTLLETGELPLTYKTTENQYVNTDISKTVVRNTSIVAGVVIAILLIFMVIKNKLKGLLAAISYIGFVALYLLLIRYTNVAISLSGAIGIGIVLIMNYVLNMRLLSIDSQDNKLYKKQYIRSITKMIPMLIISIVFIFMKWIPLSSFGMLLFWGMVLMMVYNILVTKKLVD